MPDTLRTTRSAAPLVYVAWLQGVYFVLTGIWPLVNIETFQMVTGPKLDLWLVKTVGVLVTVIGGVLLVAAVGKNITRETVLLAIGSAAGLMAIDIIYTSRGRIAPIYLADAIVEIGLIFGWCVFYFFSHGERWP